jgi:hypothetical protein
MADSGVDMDLAADIGNRRLRMHQELATATCGRVQLRNVTISFSQSPERATATRGRVPLVVSKVFGKITK